MEQVFPTHSLAALAWSIADLACVRPVRWTVESMTGRRGEKTRGADGPRIGTMSSAWLREHEAESEKHAGLESGGR